MNPPNTQKSNWLELLVDIRISSTQHFFDQDSEAVSKKEASKIIPSQYTCYKCQYMGSIPSSPLNKLKLKNQAKIIYQAA
jgi:hypothetical protein